MIKNAPDHLRVLRIAAWMWMTYLVCLVTVDLIIYLGHLDANVVRYYLTNAVPASLFLVLSYLSRSTARAKLTTGLMILLISAAPIVVLHLLDLKLPPAPLSNLEGMVLRQLPVLMIALVLVAWHYRLTIMVVYSFILNAFELGLVVMLHRLQGEQLLAFAFIVIIRMVCFLVVGIFINQLITHLRDQRAALQTANQQLAHYASTLETLTVSRERNRMSRELHDTVVHTLSGLTVQLETTKAYLAINPDTSLNLLDQALNATRSGLQETRRALKALRASPLDDLGFVLALQNLASGAAERGRLALDIVLPDKPLILSPEVEQCLYRVAQEAVENVVHHANAQRLSVNLSANNRDLVLTVKDDGIGFNPEASRPGHYGISGIKERATLAGGELTITSKPNAGTTIQLCIKGYQP